MIPAETPRHLLLASVIAVAGAGAAVASLWTRPAVEKPPVVSSAPRSDYQPMQVAGVMPMGSEYAVRLEDREAAITMYVGSSEGLAITLHQQGRRYERPLSMNLMDEALHQLGAELERVQIDDVRDHAYIGSVHLKKDGREIVLDARPSDAVALALEEKVPILVANSVVAVAGELLPTY